MYSPVVHLITTYRDGWTLNMSLRRLHRNRKKLQRLTKAGASERRQLLRHGGTDLHACICECVYNVLVGNVPIAEEHKRQLSKYKDLLRAIASPDGSMTRKKKLIRQSGGNFLLALLPAIAGMIGSLL